MSPEGLPRVALIAGPTASGKSARALDLAERTGGIVINADSAQVYRDLRILSARPDAMDEARAPHRLFGHVDGTEAYSAARWANEAMTAIAEAHDGGRLPILVGGTGLYVRTLLEGIAPVPEIDPAIRAVVRALPVEDARAALETEDPCAAARIGPRDAVRIARALEVRRSTAHSILHWRAKRHGGIGGRIALEPVVLDPPTDWLYPRCEARAAAMLDGGAIAEAEALAARGLDPALPVMRAIGVPPLIEHVAGGMTRVEALERISQDTRNYAKRQRTWNRHQFPAHWLRIDPSQFSFVDNT